MARDKLLERIMQEVQSEVPENTELTGDDLDTIQGIVDSVTDEAMSEAGVEEV